ncbi:hypothetical protein Pmani_030160 [Petrolisthes manimaculis]|uniref:Uncharacterized protein n=1 Tax=Petrolisthes manimaculis TaxID=1843537 RepID=A0AAE1NW37_9EUCA|nr:hypothetical protein Pmani_030160 [Petrolisthes manimaculis]
MLSVAKPPQHSPGSQNSSSDSTESKPFASLSHAESRQTSRNALSRQPISRGGRIMYARGKGQNAELTGGGRIHYNTSGYISTHHDTPQKYRAHRDTPGHIRTLHEHTPQKTKAHQYTQGHTRIHHETQGHTRILHDTLRHTRIPHDTPGQTRIPHDTLEHTPGHSRAPHSRTHSHKVNSGGVKKCPALNSSTSLTAEWQPGMTGPREGKGHRRR